MVILVIFAIQNMKIKIVEIGKTQQKEWQAFIDEYLSRAKKYRGVELITLQPKIKRTESNEIKEAEGKLLLELFGQQAQNVVLLDELGKEFSSEGFADFIAKHTLSGKKELIFVIGGAHGFSASVRAHFKNVIALSQMTFTHQMVRLIFIEQLYRAFTILANEKYHH